MSKENALKVKKSERLIKRMKAEFATNKIDYNDEDESAAKRQKLHNDTDM
jgi:hypothetical protein